MDPYTPLEGGYGFSQFFDNITPNEWYEYSLTPQHNTRGMVDALQFRQNADKELERQVKKYGKDELAPPIHAHEGMDSAVDSDVFHRAYVLKKPGERAKSKKTKEPTHRLRQHLFKGTKISALQKSNDAAVGSRPP